MNTEDLLDDPTRIALADLAHREKVHPSTCWRSALRGIRGHILPTAKFAGRRVTSVSAYRISLETINGPSGPRGETPQQSNRRLLQAEQHAKVLGV